MTIVVVIIVVVVVVVVVVGSLLPLLPPPPPPSSPFRQCEFPKIDIFPPAVEGLKERDIFPFHLIQ